MTIDTSREAIHRIADKLDENVRTALNNPLAGSPAAYSIRALLARAEAAEEECARWGIATHESQRRYFEVVGKLDAAKAEAERMREVCWSLFHLGNGGHSLKDASWTGAKWIDGGELQEVWEEACAALQENTND